jgi:hypothetical protein
VAVTAPPHITSGVQCGVLSSPFTLGVGQEVTCRASYRFTHTDLQQRDMIQSFTVSGPYLDVPAQSLVVKAAYGCDTCSACIAQFADACRQNLPLAGSAAEVVKALGDYCLTTGRPQSSCTALREHITSSSEGWRQGLRAGAVCMQLKECVAGGQANSTTRPGSCENPRAAATSLNGARINGEQGLKSAYSQHWASAARVLCVRGGRVMSHTCVGCICTASGARNKIETWSSRSLARCHGRVPGGKASVCNGLDADMRCCCVCRYH